MLKTRKDNTGYYLGCRMYPDCKSSLWFPSTIKEAILTDELCDKVTLIFNLDIVLFVRRFDIFIYS
jgi:hypothetical protein